MAENITPNRQLRYVVGTTELERDQVFSVSVAEVKFAQVFSRIREFARNGITELGGPNDAGGWFLNFSSAGVVAFLNVKVQEFGKTTDDGSYRTGLDGFFANIELCNRKTLSSESSQLKYKVKCPLDAVQLKPFMTRFADYMDETIYDNLLRNNFPVDLYIKRRSLPAVIEAEEREQARQNIEANRAEAIKRAERLEAERKRKAEEMLTQAPPKLVRISPLDLTFQQQETQDPRANRQVAQTLLTQRNLLTQSLALQSPAPQSLALQHLRTLTSGVESSGDESEDSRWNLRDVHSIDFAQLANLRLRKIQNGTEFETICPVSHISPAPRDIFVRPFGRTLKFQTFRIVLEDSCYVEFPLQTEACYFFGIREVEEAITRIAELQQRLKLLEGRKVRMRLQKQSRTLKGGYTMAYWGSTSQLDKLHPAM